MPSSNGLAPASMRPEGFDTELVLPAVPKIIVVEETFTQPEAKVCKAHLMRVVTEADASDLGNAVLFPVDAELVEVGIGPAHRHLEDMVQIGDGAVTTDEQTTPDHRADAEGEPTCGPRHPWAWTMASRSPCMPGAPQAMDKLPRGEYDAVETRTCAPPGSTVPGQIHHATVHRRESHGHTPSQHL
jgi:hypothetical protein